MEVYIEDETIRILEKIYLQENPKSNFWNWLYNLHYIEDEDYIYWYSNNKLVAITI
jgi:hypothetical protein